MFSKKKKKVRLLNFIQDYCNEAKRASRIKSYRRIAILIESFEKSINKEIYTDSFDEDTTHKYINFIRDSKKMRGESSYRQSTIRHFKEKTISILGKAECKGFNVVLDHLREYSIYEEDTCSVYLTTGEIKSLLDMDLKKEQAKVRDLFLIGCCTALRYSDYSRLTAENFAGETISILTQKTDTRVVIPMHGVVKEIILRNNGYSFLLYKESQQNFNMILKRICKKAGISDEILIERTEGFQKIKRVYKKWQLVSSHTARRSGATNMYLAGIATFRIMLITGHKTESAFYRYIRIQKEENANILGDHPFFR